MSRLPAMTRRFAGVTLLGVLGAVGRPAAAEDAAPDPGACLRAAERTQATPAERRAAVEALLATGSVPDGDRAVRVAAALVGEDAELAGRLARAALDAGWVRPDARAALAAAARRALGAADAPAAAAVKRAVLVLAGARPAGAALLAPPTPPFVRAVVARDAPELLAPGAPDAAPLPAPEAWDAHAAVAADLDHATEDDPAVAFAGLDALVAAGARARPLLLATAARRPDPTPAGQVPRRVRAVVALGAAGDPSAVPTLLGCLDDREVGWVRVAAVRALGDLGDPRALGPVARILFYQGDRQRPHDGWEYPGATNVDVPWEAWADVPYWAVDSAAAETLLRLGVRNAAEWLVEERLDPRTGRWRIRVTQDAIEAIRRAFPSAPPYEPDAGYPQRQAAVDALRAWWRTGPQLERPLAEARPEVAAELHRLADAVGGPGVGVMDLMIAKRVAACIGPAMTPSVLEVLATSKRKVQRAELAVVLGWLRDRRAVGPLLDLTRDPVPAVRANAAEALATYADPAWPATLAGASPHGADAIVARWTALLDDPEAGPRASAVKALTSVPPSPAVLAALEAHGADRRPENDFLDYRLADVVARWVHGGEGLDRVLGLLDAPVLFQRRYVWELVWPALRLDPRAFDPLPDPGAKGRRVPARDEVVVAFARRRGA